MSDLNQELFDQLLDLGIRRVKERQTINEAFKIKTEAILEVLDGFLKRFFESVPIDSSAFNDLVYDYLKGSDWDLNTMGILDSIFSDVLEIFDGQKPRNGSVPKDLDWNAATYILIMRNGYAFAIARPYKFAPDFTE